MSLIVYTALFGYTDPLHEPLCQSQARFVCYTDQPLKSQRWEIIRVPRQDFPTRISRLTKAMSHKLLDCEWSLWMDANFTIITDPYLLLDDNEISLFKHPDRTRITDEAQEIIRLQKTCPDKIRAQLAAYKADGFDTDSNPQKILSQNGVILRKHTPQICKLNEMWAHEIHTKSLRDQMSLNYCAWKLGVDINYWPGYHRNNSHFLFKHFKRPVNDV